MKEHDFWWHPDKEFFGIFYHSGDHSRQGFDINETLTRRERTIREVNYIKTYLSPKSGEYLLDCPCGNGRHSVELALDRINVHGIDINPTMLSFMESNDAKQSNLNFSIMDMRNLEFPNDKFHYLINMFISFGFFETDEENEKVVKEFYRVLKPGGKVLIHLDLNYDNVINGNFSSMEHRIRTSDFKDDVKDLQITERYEKDKKRLYGEWILMNGKSESKKYSLRVYDNKKEFIPLFEKYGFKDVTLLDPRTEKFPDESSVETILIATK